jgi:NADH:ubiquinone oxidoreductase subunit 4 (subunit M)
VVGTFGIVINAGLMLWTIQRVLQGVPSEQMQANYDFVDLKGIELAAVVPLVFLAILWGLWPPSLSPMIDSGLSTALEAIAQASSLVGVLP